MSKAAGRSHRLRDIDCLYIDLSDLEENSPGGAEE
jgi:hypothetical protein